MNQYIAVDIVKCINSFQSSQHNSRLLIFSAKCFQQYLKISPFAATSASFPPLDFSQQLFLSYYAFILFWACNLQNIIAIITGNNETYIQNNTKKKRILGITGRA
jgi:hypothetical protein